MTEHDFDGFVREFNRLSSALERFKTHPEQQAQKADAYFHALKHLPLAEVIAKADAWLKAENKFPTPHQWAHQIVSRGPELETISDRDAREYGKAERAGYEGEPCACRECLEAGIEQKPIRYVPDVNADGSDRRVKDGVFNRIIVAGHWAHGWELRRWYEAKGAFYNRCMELGLRGDVLQQPGGKAKRKARKQLSELVAK